MKIVIFGATSAIAQSLARILIKENDLFLVGRNPQKLEAIANDLQVRGGKKVGSLVADLEDLTKHPEILSQASNTLGTIDTAVLAHGELGTQASAQASVETSTKILNANFTSYVSLLTLLANQMEAKKSGMLVLISSVAGDRGRQSNYVYGTAKGALTLFAQGLRNRLYHSGVSVLTLKLGFVDTPMTKDFKKGLLWAKPDGVAKTIHKAMLAKKDVVYVPFFWRYIMTIICAIPEKVFKRLRL